MSYKRFTKKDRYGHWCTDTKINDRYMWSEDGKVWERDLSHYAFDGEAIDRLAELEDKIENGTLKEVVRCKDCVYFQPEYVEMENKKRRPYTEEEIKNGKFVSLEKGINCGSRCERFGYWEKNSYPVWFNENDFCSYGKPKPKIN